MEIVSGEIVSRKIVSRKIVVAKGSAVRELVEAVGTEYDRLGLPSWPDPHRGGLPAEDTYSRVTDPQRYRIVHERARVWGDVLAALPGVTRSGARLEPAREGALPVFLTERPGQEIAVLDIGFGRADVVVATFPECGCDACDRGSADLLSALDDVVVRLVGGPYVVLRGAEWGAQWYPDGGSASGLGLDYDRMMATCRRLADGDTVDLPDGGEAFVGHPWLP